MNLSLLWCGIRGHRTKTETDYSVRFVLGFQPDMIMFKGPPPVVGIHMIRCVRCQSILSAEAIIDHSTRDERENIKS